VVSEGASGHDLGGAQCVAAMNEVDSGSEAREIRCFLAGGVTATDHDERLVAEHGERAVASGAVGDAFFLEQFLAFQAEMTMTSAAGDDHGLAFDDFPVDVEEEGAFGKIDRFDGPEFAASAEAFGLLLHAGHQLIAVDAFGKAREILNDTGRREEPAGHDAGEDERLKVGTGGVKSGREACATGAYNDDFFHK